MNPNEYEKEMSHVLCLLDELENGVPEGGWQKSSNWQGYHPRVYSTFISRSTCDRLVRELCTRLQSVDVTKYSLELQMWWRDHQEADRARLEDTLRRAEERHE